MLQRSMDESQSSLLKGDSKKVLDECFNGIIKPSEGPCNLSTITFNINGIKYTVTNPDPNTSLNEFIRSQPGLKGTKVMCHEGGCGCCVVALERTDSVTGKQVTLSVNSCLFPLYAANDCEVTTTEGIGNRKYGFHAIQKRVAEHNGSQCGFCTPGMVMNMYSLLKENPKPSKQQIEDNFDGNICRCTGYRPILDAMKSFAADSNPIDIEELDKCSGKCDDCPCKRQGSVPTNKSGVKWFAPKNLTELYAILDNHSSEKIKLVAGNTGKGVFKKEGPFDVLVDINAVQELHRTTEVNSHLVVGGGLSLSSFIKLCEQNSDKSTSFSPIAKHLRVVANTPVRNVGSLAGNLMLAHDHSDFPSDLMAILVTAGASLLIGGPQLGQESSKCFLNTKCAKKHTGQPQLSQVSLKDFLTIDMENKVIVAIVLPFLPDDVVMRTFKITPRSQNAHAYVNAGFVFQVDKSTLTVTSQPRVVYGGITYNFFRGEKTEQFLVGKKLTDPDILKAALETLDSEVIPSPELIAHNGSTVAYHKDLALALFYKAYVAALGENASPRVQSAGRSLLQERAISSGIQNFETKPDMYPITKPMTKIAAKLQASGEAEYVNDIPTREGEVYAAFVTSTKGNCKIDKIDASEALSMPGVIKFFDHKDIPEGGKNSLAFFSMFFPLPGPQEGVFCEGDVLYAGQALGVIIAETQQIADKAALAVKVTYKECKPPILTIQQAIDAKSFGAPSPLFPDINVGDAEASMTSSPHVISGEIECGGQHHFHMETQVSLCISEENGLTLYSACQGGDIIQMAVSRFLGVSATSVDVIVRRCGGAFGAKATRSMQVACACALASKLLDRPVKMKMNFNTNMQTMGGRSPHMTKYKAAFNDEGILQGIILDYYADTGCNQEDNDLFGAIGHWDNLYYCPNWKISNHTCLTNKASTTFCRAPGMLQSVFFMESIMEHVAKALNKTPEEIRERNLYENGQKTPTGEPIPHCKIRGLWKELLESSEFINRKAEVEEFNKNNRWRKRGLSLVPGKFNVESFISSYTVFVSIFKHDGTVAISHGGVEMGQGINVKTAQVASHTLGIPMDHVIIKPNYTVFSPNSSGSGGSVTSEMCCEGVMECCKILNDRIKPIRAMKPDASWRELIAMCGMQGVDLSAKYLCRGKPRGVGYVSYGVTCAEAEVDILTGERIILRSDILFDCGESMNPEIDIGQVEGAFVFGMGYWLTEKLYYDPETGEELSAGTWTYKPPTTKDIPVDLRVTLLKNTPNPLGFLGSKAVGEPPITMSCSCLFAVKHAVEEARNETGNNDYFTLNGPATVEHTQQSCLVYREQLTI